jgi:hypothetical protein
MHAQVLAYFFVRSPTQVEVLLLNPQPVREHTPFVKFPPAYYIRIVWLTFTMHVSHYSQSTTEIVSRKQLMQWISYWVNTKNVWMSEYLSRAVLSFVLIIKGPSKKLPAQQIRYARSFTIQAKNNHLKVLKTMLSAITLAEIEFMYTKHQPPSTSSLISTITSLRWFCTMTIHCLYALTACKIRIQLSKCAVM